MTSVKTIVFGPTGAVGSATARAAQEQGAKVVLGMRDPTKPITGLSPEDEQRGGIERVHADLSKPETLHEAVTKTGATRAFIYLLFEAKDGMKSILTTLKSAGIEYVVFLSSDAVPDSLDIRESDHIAQIHGEVELSLKEVFGAGAYAAVRAGWFASNSLRWKDMFKEREIKIPYAEAYFDWISPQDIGSVCGGLLSKAPRDIDGRAGPSVVRIAGPNVLTQAEAVDVVAKSLGKEVKITSLSFDEGVKFFVSSVGLPEPAAKALVDIIRIRAEGGKADGGYEGLRYEERVANIRKYSGREATPFQQWVDENKKEFDV
ncbi:unnamed protein product [Clonostachys byssicola]|uniref:NmrA-like domain-containing protein n=1 Tax=Clonostachys byssicola TaxID=160290 RepID=A0A9N9U2K2_9HYPO|nr:unnamed protein product [Clonostachys byssicola]